MRRSDGRNARGHARRATIATIATRLALIPALAALAALAGPLAGCSSSRSEPRFDAQVIPMEKPAKDGVRPAGVPVAARARPLLFSIAIPAHMAGTGLEVRILDRRGEIAWVGVGLRGTENLPTGQLLVPPGFLLPGDYTLAVGKAQPGVPRAEFPFRVE